MVSSILCPRVNLSHEVLCEGIFEPCAVDELILSWYFRDQEELFYSKWAIFEVVHHLTYGIVNASFGGMVFVQENHVSSTSFFQACVLDYPLHFIRIVLSVMPLRMLICMTSTISYFLEMLIHQLTSNVIAWNRVTRPLVLWQWLDFLFEKLPDEWFARSRYSEWNY